MTGAWLFLLCPGSASRAPPSGRPKTRTRPAGPCRAARGRAGGLPDLPRPLWRSSRAWERTPIRERDESSARPTKPRPCPCLRRFRGRGPAKRDSYSDPAKPASRHLPAWRAWQAEAPLRPASGLARSRPPTRRAPRPGPRRQPASPEGADRAPAAADSSGERGRPVTTGARGPGDAVVSVLFVGGQPNELSARTSRAPPPSSRRLPSRRGLSRRGSPPRPRSLQISARELGHGGLCWGLQDDP